jgi:hypothetical protein
MSCPAANVGTQESARAIRAGDRGVGAVALWMLMWKTRVMLAVLMVPGRR